MGTDVAWHDHSPMDRDKLANTKVDWLPVHALSRPRSAIWAVLCPVARRNFSSYEDQLIESIRASKSDTSTC